MNKILLFLFLYLLHIYSYAQNYTCIKTDAITHFLSDNGNIASVRIDSTAQYNDTSDYISYNMVRPVGGILYSYKGASWIGKKFTVMPDGDNVFYNVLHEPVIIKTPAILNNSWQAYYSQSNNIVINATVTSIGMLSFLGISDSVANINFFAADTNGIPIQNPVNYFTLQLSKNYGFVKIFHFYYFPFISQTGYDNDYELSNSLNLTGINNPVLGWQNITAYDIYNWNTGWEFHSYQVSSPPPGGPGSWGDEKMIRVILNKQLFADSVSYLVERCYHNRSLYGGTLISEVHGKDTVTETYFFNSNLNKLSCEPYYENPVHIRYYIKTLNSIQQQLITFEIVNNDTCQQFSYDGFWQIIWHTQLGSTYHWEGIAGDNGDYYFVYYKKDSLEWGTPYSCSTLLEAKLMKGEDNAIRIYPNPSAGKFNVEFENPGSKPVNFSIVNLAGKIVSEEITNEKICNIDITDLPGGYYILKITAEEGVYHKSVVKE